MRAIGRLLVVGCPLFLAVSWSVATGWKDQVMVAAALRLPPRFSSGSRLKKEVIAASDARGRPLSGVTVFNVDCWSGEGTLVGRTNKAGKIDFIDSDAIVGITRNGAVSSARVGTKLIFRTPGVVKLHVVDSHGKPIANKRMFLIPTSASGPLRPYGFFRGAPHYPGELATRLSGVTDHSGFIQFSKIDKKAPFDVVTDVGSKLGSLGYFGSVHAGTTAEVVISHDRSLVECSGLERRRLFVG